MVNPSLLYYLQYALFYVLKDVGSLLKKIYLRKFVLSVCFYIFLLYNMFALLSLYELATIVKINRNLFVIILYSL